MMDEGMRGQKDSPAPVVTRRIAAEAAMWIARLHGPSRSVQMEQELRLWLAQSEAHRHAFERCTDVWEEVPGLSVADAYGGAAGRAMRAAMARERWWMRLRWPLLCLLIVVLATGAYVTHRWWTVKVYDTQIGEQRQLTLADGTRMFLNTDTRTVVEIDAEHRSVRLERGEALFEVAKDAKRPFVVRAADSEVVAIGTVFAVRLPERRGEAADGALAVMLIEGRVSVRPVAGEADGIAPARPVMMEPGERIQLSKTSARPGAAAIARIDRPRIEQMVAWKRGEAVFDDVALPEAVGEMNRYARTPIVLLGPAAKLRVSGLYHTGDTRGFAQAVAALHGLQVREHGGRLELALPQ